MTKEELKQEAEKSRLSTKSGHDLSYDPKYREVYDKGYIAGATEATKELKEQIEKMVNEIDKTMVLSNMRECEICDIQDIFRKYGFKRNGNDVWEIKENE